MVELNCDLPDELFSTALPAGYAESGRSVAAADVSEVFAKYEQARNQIAHYRLIAWEKRFPKDPMFRPVVRSARYGEKWRVDDVGAPKIAEETPFDTTWAQLVPAPNGVSMYYSEGRYARILRDDGKICDYRTHDDPNANRYLLTQLGWPAWPDNPLSSLTNESARYRRLPDRPDHPGLIGIEYTQEADANGRSAQLAIFWIDPARDYLCVYHENHWRKTSQGQDNPDAQASGPMAADQPQTAWTSAENYTAYENYSTEEIIGFRQSPEGRWYPTAVRSGSGVLHNDERHYYGPDVTRIQVDFTGPIPGELFEFPADVPKPQ